MTVILDSRGNTITQGARVRSGDEYGVVLELTEPDGDAHDDGTPYGIAPRVVVGFDDNTIEKFPATWNATGPWDDHRDDYTCDDVTVTP